MADKMGHRNQPRNFSEIKIGDKAEFEVMVDEKLHGSFSKIIGDFSPIHCDEEFSEKTKFGKRIGYAFMLTGFLSRLYGEYLPGGSSVCIKQDAEFIRPFFIGDKIKIAAEVTSKSESTKFVEIKSEMFRNGNERIFRGKGVVQLLY
jgi:3-hydroxybutyryl-CoA dehydratase